MGELSYNNGKSMQMVWRRDLFDTQDGLTTLLDGLLENANTLKERVSEHGSIKILAEVANFLAQFGNLAIYNHVPLRFVDIALGWANDVGKKYSIAESGTATDRKAMQQLAERYKLAALNPKENAPICSSNYNELKGNL
jgi:hypothetical protein